MDELACETKLPVGITTKCLLGLLTSGAFCLRPMVPVVGCVGAVFFYSVPPWGALECAMVLRLDPLLIA